jgi:hypothetical protein
VTLADFLLSVLAGAVGAALTLSAVAGGVYLAFRHTLRRIIG